MKCFYAPLRSKHRETRGIRPSLFQLTCFLTLSFIFLIHPAHAQLPFDLSDFTDQYLNLITEDIANPVVSLIGIGLEHRAYEPATTLGNSMGLFMGVEASLVKIPDTIGEALKEAGLKDPLPVLSIPLPRLHLHKGLGKRLNVGSSLIKYDEFMLWGGNIQWMFHHPDEGPTYALRFSYTKGNIDFMKTKTYSLTTLLSRRMAWADPYLGLGYHWSFGKIEVPIPEGIIPSDWPPEIQSQLSNLSIKGQGRARGYFGLVGVAWHIKEMGIQISIEGSYAQTGTHTMGTKVGLRF